MPPDTHHRGSRRGARAPHGGYVLADAQRGLEGAQAERDRLAPVLDSRVADAEQALTGARDAAIAGADRGFGARWLAMNAHTLASPGATVLRAVTVSVFVLLFLLPCLLRPTTLSDHRASASVEQERADLEAETAIAVTRAQVREQVETLWAERELASAQLAAAAQTEIEREEHRRRVDAARQAPTAVSAERIPEAAADVTTEVTLAAPAALESTPPSKRATLPMVPDVAGAAMRWVRPFVPPIIATAIETTTRPLRARGRSSRRPRRSISACGAATGSR
ncbi:hypothetical protein H7H73_16270 [Mycobacterium rufum]|uniref:Uncharacterized protein n=1 Tax=Mycolicibacterium rufum TaxID=318424 RepID=A0A9X2YEB1_9MYCO|nr:hypothetical protein [Mycolicibacterium rufum]